MSNSNVLRIVLSLAIIAGFFLPWFNYLIPVSGWDIVMSKSSRPENNTATVLQYSFLLIPFFAIIVFLVSLGKKSAGFLLRAASFIVTAILTALFVLGMSEQGGTEGLNAFASILSYGFYVTAAASFLLMFVGGKATAEPA